MLDLNQQSIKEMDFKSIVSTNFTKRAFKNQTSLKRMGFEPMVQKMHADLANQYFKPLGHLFDILHDSFCVRPNHVDIFYEEVRQIYQTHCTKDLAERTFFLEMEKELTIDQNLTLKGLLKSFQDAKDDFSLEKIDIRFLYVFA